MFDVSVVLHDVRCREISVYYIIFVWGISGALLVYVVRKADRPRRVVSNVPR